MAETVADIAIGLTADISPLMRETARAGKAVNKFGADMSRDVGKGAQGVQRALGQASVAAASFGKSFVSGIALGVVSAGMAAMTTNIRATIGAIADMVDEADRVGVSVENFQELQYGMKLAGVQADEFASALSKFSDNIGDAARGSGNLKNILEQNGIALRDVDGGVRGTTELLSDFADMIQRVPDEATRMSLITEAFGKGGKAMTLALADGSAGLAAMQQAARDAGVVLDESVTRKAAELDDKFDELTARATVFFQTIAVGAADMAAFAVGVGDLADRERALEAAAAAAGGELSRVFGTELADAMNQNTGAIAGTVDEMALFGANIRQIRSDAQTFSDDVFALSDRLNNLGETGAAEQVDRLGAAVLKAGDEFDQGLISGQEYKDKMGELAGAVQGLMIILGDVEGADFSAAQKSASSFEAVITSLGDAADRAYQKIRAAMGLSSTLAAGVSTEGAVVLAGDRTGIVPRSELAPTHSPRPGRRDVDFEHTPEIDAPPVGAGPSSADLDALLTSLETEKEILDNWYAESQAMLANATDAQLAQIGGRHEAIQRLEQEHQEKLAEIRGIGDEAALGHTASFFNMLANITKGGGDKALKAHRVFAAGEALINAYRASNQVLADPTVPTWLKLPMRAAIWGQGLMAVKALGGSASASGGGFSGGSSGGRASAAAPAVANITLNGMINDSGLRSLTDRLNDEFKQGYVLNVVSA